VSDVIRLQAEQSLLLTLGRRGNHHHDRHDYLGRHFREIAHHVQCPILTTDREWREIHRVLVVFDGSERSQHAISWAARLQRVLQCTIQVLSIADHDEATVPSPEAVRAVLEEHGVTNYQAFTRKGLAANVIVDTAAERDVDLIILGGYRYGAFVEWLVGSTVDQVLRATPQTVLIT
jgi:nucleotide-binding universal stress UspA family protein